MNSQVRDLTVQVCSTIASDDFRSKIAQALPDGITPERFTRVALTAIQQNPDLCDADRQSLYSSVIRCAQDGLLPDGREAALVIYNTKVGNNWVKKVQYQPMVTGIIKRFGEAGIQAYAASVYSNDVVRLWNDEKGQHVEHNFEAFGERGEFIGVYACAMLADGRTYVEPLNMTEIDKIANASKSKDREGNIVGPWRDWKDRMAQKSGLHRLGRRVPVTRNDAAAERLASALAAEGDLYGTTTAAPGGAGAATGLPAPAPAKPTGPRRPRGLDTVAAAGNGASEPNRDVIDGESSRVDDHADEPDKYDAGLEPGEDF